MAFVPAVPEAVAAGFTLADVLIALTAALGWAVCFGLLFAWNYTLGYLLNAVADALSSVRVWKFHIPVGPIRALDNAVQHSLSAGISTFDHAMGLFFHFAGLLLAWMANFAMATAQDTLHFARWLTGDHLPKYVKWAVRAAFPLAWLTKLIAQQIAKVLPKVGRWTRTVVHESTAVVWKLPRALDRRLTRTERRIAALYAALAAVAGALPLPHAFPSFRRTWREIEQWRKVTAKRLVRLERLLAASGLALAVANMTGTSVRCWRGQGNIARALRHICGVPSWLLDLLVLGAVEAFIVTDLCAFTDLLIAETEHVVPVLMELVDVEDALIGCHGTVKPMLFNLPTASLPPLQGVSPLAA